MNDFQERLQELLDEKKLNRLNLAKRIGISSTTVNGYFNKNYYPSIDIAIKLSEFFDCSLDYLFGLSDDRENKYKEKDTKLFVNNLKRVVKENKVPVAKAFENMKLGEYDYYRWRDGKFPRTINLIEFAKYFDVSIDYLIGRSDEK